MATAQTVPPIAPPTDANLTPKPRPKSRAKRPPKKVTTDHDESFSTPDARAPKQSRPSVSEADVIAFHLSRSTPHSTPSSSKPVAASSSSKPKTRISQPSSSSFPSLSNLAALTRISLSSEHPSKIPSRALSQSLKKRSPLADSSSLPETENVAGAGEPSQKAGTFQEHDSTENASTSIKKVSSASEKKRKRVSTSKKQPIPSPRTSTRRPRGNSKSSEGQSSDIIPELSDDDEGYDQLLSSSQPIRPSLSPLMRMTSMDETPTASRQAGQVDSQTTPTGKKPVKKRARKSAGETVVSTKSVDAESEEVRIGGEEKQAEKEKEKRRTKGAAQVKAAPVSESMPSVASQEEGDKSKGTKKRKIKAARSQLQVAETTMDATTLAHVDTKASTGTTTAPGKGKRQSEAEAEHPPNHHTPVTSERIDAAMVQGDGTTETQAKKPRKSKSSDKTAATGDMVQEAVPKVKKSRKSETGQEKVADEPVETEAKVKKPRKSKVSEEVPKEREAEVALPTPSEPKEAAKEGDAMEKKKTARKRKVDGATAPAADADNTNRETVAMAMEPEVSAPATKKKKSSKSTDDQPIDATLGEKDASGHNDAPTTASTKKGKSKTTSQGSEEKQKKKKKQQQQPQHEADGSTDGAAKVDAGPTTGNHIEKPKMKPRKSGTDAGSKSASRKEKKSTTPSWQVGTPVASSPPGP